MEIRHFDIATPETKPPQREGWEREWHGYHRLKGCWTETIDESVLRAVGRNGEIGEREFEIDCFLSILSDIKRDRVVMFELGAGWGEWCLALAGVIDYRIVPVNPSSYFSLAVEAEPTHYKWAVEHFRMQKISGEVVYGAMFSKNGWCRFNTSTPPDIHYGQSISFMRIRSRSAVVGFLNLLKGKAVKVPMFTIDRLVETYGLGHVDIVQMDVQFAECEVVKGAERCIEDGVIDYFLIGTHKREYNGILQGLLSPKYDLIVDLLPFSVNRADGFPPIRCNDGIQLYKRRS